MTRNDYSSLSDQDIENAVLIFKALSDPTRIRILYLISKQECSVSHIAEKLNLSQSAVSHQLSFLRSLRLVRSRREGRTMYYTCDDDHVVKLLHQTLIHVQHD